MMGKIWLILAAVAAFATPCCAAEAPRRPLFSPRMIHSGEGFDTFSDGYLEKAAAAGFDSILFYVWNAEEPRASELRDLIARAKKRGLGSYLYSRINTQAFVHPDDPKAEAVFDATYGKMAAAFPEARGVLFVGESFEFPSKDERSCGLAIDYSADRRAPGDTRPYVGWYPCRDYAKLIEAVKRSLHKVNPDLEVILWSYNWGYCDEGPRRELIRLLPKDVPLLVTFEMFEKYRMRNGLDCKIADYSIAFEGPGKYFVSEAEEAKACGLKLYGMVNTACRTWDLGVVPYMPVPYQWKKRWDAIRDAQRKWGLCGLVESHHFGWTPNFVSELCKEAFTEGGRDFDEHIRAIAARDFGERNADAALAVWKEWSEAVCDTKPCYVNLDGPFRYGPAYPFNALRPDVTWSDFALSPMFIDPNYRQNAGKEDNSDASLKLETELLDSVIERFAKGAARFAAFGTPQADEQARLGEFISRCYRTAANVKRGLMAERAKDEAEVLRLARDEYENTRAAIVLVNADPRLGWEPRMGRRCDERALKMKMKWMERHYFGGAVTEAEPYPEMDVSLDGRTLAVKNRTDRDFESGGLNVVQRDADGREIGKVRLTSPLIRRGEEGRILLPFDPARISGLRRLDLSFEQFEYGTILTRTVNVEAPVVAEVCEHGGAPALWIDGRPDTGLMHWNRRMTPEDVAIFRDAGVHLFSFMGAPEMPNPDGGPVDYSDGMAAKVPVLTPQYIDETMKMIVRTDPKAKVLLRLRLTTPDWWRRQHPGETVRIWDEETKGGWYDHKWGAPSSEAWCRLMEESVRRTIRHCEKTWPGRIIGYHPGLGSCAENSYDWGQSVADFSRVSRGSSSGKVPDPEAYFSRSIVDSRRLLDPVEDAEAIAFRRNQSRTMADAVLRLSHAVKDELARLGRRKVCGAFYGYFCFSPNRMQFFASGHGDFKRVLESPDIDLICAPLDYSSRAPGNVALAQTLPASVALHGKLYYGEEDTRFHTANSPDQCVSGDPKTSCDLLWRNFANAYSQGGSMWWMDLFGEGWYRDRDLARTVRDCRAFAEAHLANRTSVAQIAVFVSERSPDYERVAPIPLANEVLSPTLNEVASVGAPFDVYLLEDLPLLSASGRLAQYRLAVLPNAHAVDSALREEIRRSLCADGRTVVFQGLPGYVCGREKGVECVKRLTGIAVRELANRNAATAEAFPDGRRIVWGSVHRSDPQLVIADPEAEELGWFVQGTVLVKPGVSNGGALASRRFPNWRSVICTIHSLPSELLRHFAAEAGVHVYSEHGDQVFAGPDWCAMSAKMPGRHVMRQKDGSVAVIQLGRGGFKLMER